MSKVLRFYPILLMEEILHQLRLVVYPTTYRVLARSQVVFSPDSGTIISSIHGTKSIFTYMNGLIFMVTVGKYMYHTWMLWYYGLVKFFLGNTVGETDGSWSFQEEKLRFCTKKRWEIWLWRFWREQFPLHPWKTNMSPKKVGNTSSNHHFSGDMLNFGGVTIWWTPWAAFKAHHRDMKPLNPDRFSFRDPY